MIARTGVAGPLLWLLAAGAAYAAPCDAPRPIHVVPGTNSAEAHGGIARGELDCLTIAARAGQGVRVTIASVEDNVVLQLYRPAWTMTQQDGAFTIAGTTLPGAEEGTDARSWSGVLPASGAYLMVLGTTRGGGEYRLKLEIE